MNMMLSQVARALNVAAPAGADITIAGVSTDTRTLNPGELFFALSGPSFDGHDYCGRALERGAAAVVVARAVDVSLPQLVVADPRRALGQLAAAWRQRFTGPLVAITGSNGKTTVKEMISAILRQRGEVLATAGNLNNDIGVPLTLFRLQPGHHDYAVIEMGANHVGEIAGLTALAQPDVALVTNVGKAHLEGFGSLDDVARAKGEIWQGLKEDGVAVLNADDAYIDYWTGLVAAHRQLRFGSVEDVDVRLTSEDGWQAVKSGFRNRFTMMMPAGMMPAGMMPTGMTPAGMTPVGPVTIDLPLAGRHNIMNALAATAATLAAGAELADVKAGLEAMTPVRGRLQPHLTHAGQLLIDDSYNANPQSLHAAMEVLAGISSTAVLVLGDMAELGDTAAELHCDAGRSARQLGISYVYGVGALAAHACRGFGEGARCFDDQAELIKVLRQDLQALGSDTAVLVKGSRSARMEQVVAALSRDVGEPPARTPNSGS